MRPILAVLAVAPVVVLAACGTSEPATTARTAPEPAALPAVYSYDLTSSCGERSLIGSYRVWVEDDEVTRVEPVGRTPMPSDLAAVPTIDDLEALIGAAETDAVVEIERDDGGVLRSLSIDHLPDAIDDEECYEVGGVREELPGPRVSCGGDGPGWEADAMAGGIQTETPRADIAAALRRTEDEMGIDGPFAGTRRWIVLAEDEDVLTIGTGRWTAEGPGDDAMVVTYDREGDQLDWSGHGQCLHLAPVLTDDRSWVQVTAPPEGLDRSATDLTVLVMEHQCTGARDPRPFLDEPVLEQTPDRVLVSWTSSRPEGGATCPGNPSVPVTLVLDEPLGDRPLLDGSTWPPTEVGAPR